MKFSISTFSGVIAAAASVTAQRATIAYPTNGTDIQAGSDLLVMVARPVGLVPLILVAYQLIHLLN